MPESISVVSLAVKLERLATLVDAHIKECGEMNRQSNLASADAATALRAIAGRIENIEKAPMKAVRWIGGIVGTAALTLLVQNYMNHEDTSAIAARAATQATAAAAGNQQVIRRLDAMGVPAP